MKPYLLIVLTAAFLTSLAFSGQGQPIREKIHASHIKTAHIHEKGEPLSAPVMALNSGATITLRFDDMEGGTQSYSYQLIHCNANWEPSSLFSSNYLSGQTSGEIYNHESSFNTLRSYTHYWLNIPNETMRPTKSGNYILHVYRNYNPSDTVLTRRFRISENTARIQAEINRINQLTRKKPNQEINLKVNTSGNNIRNPYSNIKIALVKNYHRQRLLTSLSPSSINGNIISYQMNRKMAFKGGNEFHHFNSKNTEYPGEHIKNIRFARNNFHFQLNKDQDRTFKSYQRDKDVNGRFKIDKENVDNPHTQADYVYVYFTLKGVSFSPEGNYYVAGNFNNWQYTPNNKMRYNQDDKAYQKRLLLKQGYYDYKYVFRKGNALEPYRISGNHPQTENDYLIYIYYRDHQKGYDRLIGHTLINSNTIDY